MHKKFPALWALGCLGFWLAGCGQDSSVKISIWFPDQDSLNRAALLWVVAMAPATQSNCQALVSGQALPRQPGYEIRDEIEIDLTGASDTLSLSNLGSGRRLFFAEAKDALGEVFLRGCTEAQAGSGGAKSVAIDLEEMETPCQEECDDDDPCTADSCVDSQCQHTQIDKDSDGDGYRDAACPGGDDCDDGDNAVNPGAVESDAEGNCADGKDNDCDGDADGADPSCDCAPDCSDTLCGPDPRCGQSCGECDTGFSCWFGACYRGTEVPIPAGEFDMGTPGTEPGHVVDEALHHVVLTRDFSLWSTEVTQNWFESLRGYNNADNQGCHDCPIETVSWHEAAAFCNLLSEHQGLAPCYSCTNQNAENANCQLDSAFTAPYDCPGYRLPTEAEWEFAARAGTQTATFNGDIPDGSLECQQPNPVLDGIAWFCGNSANSTRAVGWKEANDNGLHDMPGNVWEWCHDRYDVYPGDETDPWGSEGNSRTARGGSFTDEARNCRLGNRSNPPPDGYYVNIGFRPARTLNP